MFFIGIFGSDSKVVPVGQISGVVCPVCGKTVSMSVCRSYSYIHFFFIPVIKYHSVYIATCPQCASVFELSAETGKQIQHGGLAEARPGDLKLLRSNLVPRCPACGAAQSEDSLFCNKCGATL